MQYYAKYPSIVAQPPYSPQGNGRQSTNAEDNPGARSRYRQKLGEQPGPQAHSRYIEYNTNDTITSPRELQHQH